MGSVSKPRCANGANCYHVVKLHSGGPPSVARGGDICEKCRKAGYTAKPADAGQNTSEFVPPWQKLPDEALRDLFTVRGIGEGDLPPQPNEPLPEESLCEKHPPCTDLLRDPAGVLSDEKRWPDHLCYELFMRRSTLEWLSSQLPESWSEAKGWHFLWPLPVGEGLVGVRLKTVDPTILGLAPFGGQEEALCIIPIEGFGGTLELFGLGTLNSEGEHRFGKLKFVLRAENTRLLSMHTQAERWWNRLRGKQTEGRPAGSGAWSSSSEFWIDLRTAVRAARDEGKEVNQVNVAKRLGLSGGAADRQLRRLLRDHGYAWSDVRKMP